MRLTIHIFLFALTWSTNYMFLSTEKIINLSLSHLLSSKRDYIQLHTQATKEYFIQIHILIFSADLS